MNTALLTKKMKIAMKVNSFSELAEKLDITLTTINNWKKRNAIPNKFLLKVTEDTGVSLDWLLSEDKPTLNIESNSDNSKNIRNILQKIHLSYGVDTNQELALRLKIAKGSVDSWTARNKIPDKYLTKCVNDTGVSLDWLLDKDKTTLNIESNSNNSKNDNDIDENTLKLINTIYSFAKINNKADEFRNDISSLLNKYM